MKIWIVWLPNVGKSTLFNALTKNYSADAQNFPFCTIEPNTWIVNVNDDRLEKIRLAVNWQKIIPASCEFIDIAWIVKWASEWEWLGNKFLANIREADAILQVVRIFEDKDIIHVHSEVNPAWDIETINSELMLADIDSVEKKIIKEWRKAKNDKLIAEALVTWELVMNKLNDWILVSNMWLSEDEQEHIYDLHLLTNKKFVYACNVSEDMMDTSEDELKKLIWISDSETKVIPICAKLESDMIEMTSAERKEFLEEMWLISTWLDNLIKASYDALDLMYYFTAWEMEVRAWTIHKWDSAPQAAWVIHTDFERWFIKAEIVSYDKLVEAGSWNKAKEGWHLRLEWKNYIMQDGDVVLFRFNV